MRSCSALLVHTVTSGSARAAAIDMTLQALSQAAITLSGDRAALQIASVGRVGSNRPLLDAMQRS